MWILSQRSSIIINNLDKGTLAGAATGRVRWAGWGRLRYSRCKRISHAGVFLYIIVECLIILAGASTDRVREMAGGS